jgi:hypothetical protein
MVRTRAKETTTQGEHHYTVTGFQLLPECRELPQACTGKESHRGHFSQALLDLLKTLAGGSTRAFADSVA